MLDSKGFILWVVQTPQYKPSFLLTIINFTNLDLSTSLHHQFNNA
jgi:hypothetical protein